MKSFHPELHAIMALQQQCGYGNGYYFSVTQLRVDVLVPLAADSSTMIIWGFFSISFLFMSNFLSKEKMVPEKSLKLRIGHKSL